MINCGKMLDAANLGHIVTSSKFEIVNSHLKLLSTNQQRKNVVTVKNHFIYQDNKQNLHLIRQN